MNEYLESLNLYWNAIGARWKKALMRCKNMSFCRSWTQSTKINSTTILFQRRINYVFKNMEDIQGEINDIFKLFIDLIKRFDLKKNEDKQALVFEQIIIFVDYFYRKLNSFYLFNTWSKNDLKSYNNMTIWGKIDSIVYREWSKWKVHMCWCSCKHYALLFKEFFDKLEKAWLNISSYIYVEKTNWLNHVWLIVTFNWKNYLIDSDNIGKRPMESFENLWEKYFDRMRPLLDLHKEDISEEITSIIKEYNGHDYNYYKVALKNENDLLELLESTPPEPLSMVNVNNILKIGGVLENILWVNFKICNEWIILFNKIFYHFDHFFTEEELNNISDENLFITLINCISYKTKKDDNKRIRVFDFEKKYLKRRLFYFSDKIDYKKLRKLLVRY